MKRQHKQLLVGVIISAVFLWLAFRRVPFSELWSFLKTINYWWTLPLVFILVFSMYWRSIRWKLILPPSRDLSAARLFGPLIIGFGLNNVFPARAGEVLRPLALAKQDGVPFGEGMGTVVIERIFDSIMLMLLFFVVLVFVPFGGITKTWDARRTFTGEQLNYALAGGALLLALLFVWLWRRSVRVAAESGSTRDSVRKKKRQGRIWAAVACVFLVVILGAVLLHPFQPDRDYTFGKQYEISGEVIRGLTHKTAILIGILLAGVIAILFRPVRGLLLGIIRRMTWFPEKLRELVIHLIETFAEGLHAIRSPLRIFLILVHSLGIWVSVALAFWITAIGVPSLELSVMEAHAFLVITCFAIMIPAAPGYWGLYEVGGIFALLVMGVTDNESVALGYTLVVHFVQWLPISLLGLFYAARIHVKPGQAISEAEAVRQATPPPAPIPPAENGKAAE